MKILLSILEGTAKTTVKTAVLVGIAAIKLKNPQADAVIAKGIEFMTALNEVMAPKTFAKSMVEGILEALHS